MQKKTYQQPAMHIIGIDGPEQLLAGSNAVANLQAEWGEEDWGEEEE